MQTDKVQTANKVAMSRALGAAFLSHQVEQLEKSVGKETRISTSNNWRDRSGQTARGGKRGGGPHPHVPQSQGARKRDRRDGERREMEAGKAREATDFIHKDLEKDADTIVVDASVLVHALGQIKKWCRDGRQEEVVIPLEALNTLDLLKKGSTPLAQRARGASRILEAQVGTNPRIRVQRDDAFVPWDDVPLDKDISCEVNTGSSRTGSSMAFAPPPEWLRRTICCCCWEMNNTATGTNLEVLPTTSPSSHSRPSISPDSRPSTPTPPVQPTAYPESQPESLENTGSLTPAPTPGRKVVFAVLTNPVPASTTTTPNSLDAGTFHPGKYERADGSLVRVWARRAGIEVLDIDPSGAPVSSHGPHQGHHVTEKRRSYAHGGADRREHREGKDGLPDRERERKPSLVEKPIAMTMVNDQPVKILRVLARGEKLDP